MSPTLLYAYVLFIFYNEADWLKGETTKKVAFCDIVTLQVEPVLLQTPL